MIILNLQTQTTERRTTVMIKGWASVVPSLFAADQRDQKSWHLLEDWAGSFGKRS